MMPGERRVPRQRPNPAGLVSDERDNLRPEDWQRILQHTDALGGWKPRKIGDDIVVVSAQTPVFMLKPDIIPVWNKGNGSRRDSRQFDSSTEQSFLEAAFDKFDIGTTIEASTPVGGAGLSGSFAKSIEQTLSSGKSQEIQSFYLFHEFPHATVSLQSSSLVPSENFLHLIETSQTRFSNSATPTPQDREIFSTTLRKFQDTFGTVFAGQVSLGGRRNAIQRIYRRSQNIVGSAEERTAIDATLAVPLTVGSIKSGGAHSWGSTSSNENSGNVVIDVKSLVVNGGDEALTEDVEGWQHTLKPPKNWKVIKQENVTALLPFLMEVLDNMQPRYNHIEFVRAMFTYEQELREALERERAAVTEPLNLWISSSYTAPKPRNLFSKLFKAKVEPIWRVRINTDKPDIFDLVKILTAGYHKGIHKDYNGGTDKFPDGFPVSLTLPLQRSLIPTQTTEDYPIEFIAALQTRYEWRSFGENPPRTTLNQLEKGILRFNVILGPLSRPVTIRCEIHAKL